MTHDAIERILATEEQAQVLCRVSEERAAEMRADMEREAAAHLAQVEAKMQEKYEQRIAEVKAGTDALLQKKREAAEKEALAIREAAAKKVERAVNLLVWGIVEKCQ